MLYTVCNSEILLPGILINLTLYNLNIKNLRLTCSVALSHTPGWLEGSRSSLTPARNRPHLETEVPLTWMSSGGEEGNQGKEERPSLDRNLQTGKTEIDSLTSRLCGNQQSERQTWWLLSSKTVLTSCRVLHTLCFSSSFWLMLCDLSSSSWESHVSRSKISSW